MSALNRPPIVIGKPLIQSRAFPPLNTVYTTFTVHGIPSFGYHVCLINLTIVNSMLLVLFRCNDDRFPFCFFAELIQLLQLLAIQLKFRQIFADDNFAWHEDKPASLNASVT